jgi:Protein of unknown function (DUF3489)
MTTIETTEKTADAAAQNAPETNEKPTAKKSIRKQPAPKAKKSAKKAARPTKTAKNKHTEKESRVPREFSKKAAVIDLLRRKTGATLAEIAKATNWQNHTIRGFVSGTLTKKMRLSVESTKGEDGRTYRIVK